MNLSCALGASIFAFLGPTGWVVATNGVFFHIFFQTSSVVRLFDTATNGILIFYYNWKTSDFRVHALSALAMSAFTANQFAANQWPSVFAKGGAASNAVHVLAVQLPLFFALFFVL